MPTEAEMDVTFAFSFTRAFNLRSLKISASGKRIDGVYEERDMRSHFWLNDSFGAPALFGASERLKIDGAVNTIHGRINNRSRKYGYSIRCIQD